MNSQQALPIEEMNHSDKVLDTNQGLQEDEALHWKEVNKPEENDEFSQKRDGSATNTGQIYIPPKDEGKMFVGGLNWETTDGKYI